MAIGRSRSVASGGGAWPRTARFAEDPGADLARRSDLDPASNHRGRGQRFGGDDHPRGRPQHGLAFGLTNFGLMAAAAAQFGCGDVGDEVLGADGSKRPPRRRPTPRSAKPTAAASAQRVELAVGEGQPLIGDKGQSVTEASAASAAVSASTWSASSNQSERPTMTDLVSVKASMLPQPPSRPSPDCLYPPNGALGQTVYSLMPTVPARMALAMRKARATLVV